MNSDLKLIIKKQRLKVVIIFSILLLLLFLSVILSVNTGFVKKGTDVYRTVILDIRLPRILSAIIIGSGLAVSGAVFQSLLINPLADSYTIGVSSGALFGVALAIYTNIFIPHIKLPITLFAFIGAISALFFVISIAKVKGYISASNLVIAGIIISSILSAFISFLKSASGENVSAIIFWLIGSLAAKNWNHVLLGYLTIPFCMIIAFYYSKDMNIISFGDREALSLGINPRRLRMILLICASFITAVCVSIAGVIGFIGLIVPHLLRFMIGSDNRKLLPLSALFGGIILLLSDTITRLLFNQEIPVGVVTTLLGGPFFVYIFIKKGRDFF